jgi:hypothetical protein
MIPTGYRLLANGDIVGRRGLILDPRIDKDGYLRAGRHLVHRVICETFHGPCPFPEAEVRHLDGNKLNNSPSNLAWGTHAENEADKIQHGTSSQGETNPSAKLTEQQVREIRERHAVSGGSFAALARDYGVTGRQIGQIVRRKQWKHI